MLTTELCKEQVTEWIKFLPVVAVSVHKSNFDSDSAAGKDFADYCFGQIDCSC